MTFECHFSCAFGSQRIETFGQFCEQIAFFHGVLLAKAPLRCRFAMNAYIQNDGIHAHHTSASTMLPFFSIHSRRPPDSPLAISSVNMRRVSSTAPGRMATRSMRLVAGSIEV